LFGIPPYGGSIQQQVYYADDTLCNSNVDTTKGYPQRDDGSPWSSPFILLIDRGDCTFVKKVRNAQRAGAAGVLIADNTCLCTDEDCMAKTDIVETTCEAQEPIMADDGSGSDISVPAFMMFKQDADELKKVLIKNQHVRVEMSFSVPAPDARVEYDLWTTPKDPVTRSIQKNFKEAAIALGKDAYFTPHMYIYDGERAGCIGADFENQCYNLCTNGGRYCATDPDDDLDTGISGADVVTESLRRICIWQKYGVADGIGKEWWDYVDEFMYRCDDPSKPDYFTNEKCISDAMEHAGIDKSIIDSCMSDSGGLEGTGTNSALETQLSDREASGVVLIPSLFVNQAPVRGEMSFATAFKAVCAGYAQGYEPFVCKKCANCPDEMGCVNAGSCANGIYGVGVPLPWFAGVLTGVVVLFSCIGFIHYRRQQRYMRDQVRGILAEYMPMDENQKQTDTSVGIEDTDNEFTIT